MTGEYSLFISMFLRTVKDKKMPESFSRLSILLSFVQPVKRLFEISRRTHQGALYPSCITDTVNYFFLLHLNKVFLFRNYSVRFLFLTECPERNPRHHQHQHEADSTSIGIHFLLLHLLFMP